MPTQSDKVKANLLKNEVDELLQRLYDEDEIAWQKLLNEFSAPPESWSYDTLLGFEDFLIIRHAVTDGKSLLAYGTRVSYEKLNKALLEFGKDRITEKGWIKIVAHFRAQWYLSPIAGIIAAEIARFAGLAKSPLGQDEATNEYYGNIP